MAPLLRVTLIRPVFRAFGFAPFELFGSHYNDTGILLPYHVPEVGDGVWKTTLGRDVRFKHFLFIFFTGNGETARGDRLASFVFALQKGITKSKLTLKIIIIMVEEVDMERDLLTYVAFLAAVRTAPTKR